LSMTMINIIFEAGRFKIIFLVIVIGLVVG